MHAAKENMEIVGSKIMEPEGSRTLREHGPQNQLLGAHEDSERPNRQSQSLRGSALGLLHVFSSCWLSASGGRAS